MPSQLIFVRQKEAIDKGFAENVFIDNLPYDYKVYLFYYPGAIVNEDLERSLRRLGEMTDKNLYINIGRLNDPQLKEIIKKFAIKDFPVIILTAVDNLASPTGELLTAFIKIEDKNLLKSANESIDLIQRLFVLFMEGKINEAMNEIKNRERSVILMRIKSVIATALQETIKFFEKHDIVVSVIEGKFELRSK